MIQTRTHIKAQVCIFSASSNGDVDELSSFLADRDYNVSVLDHTDENLGELFSLAAPDIILMADVDTAVGIESALPPESEVVCILISDEIDDVFPSPIIDFVFPNSPTLIDRQLQSLLRVRQISHQQVQYLKDQLHQLESEIADLQDKLQRQQRTSDEVEILKSAIVRNVSHELKTPLLQVKSAVALLAEDVKNEELASYAKGATGRLETLVKNITLLGSSLDKNLSPVIVRDAVEYARRNIRRVWEHKDSTDRIQVELEENLPPVLADKQGLSTVLQLLLDNALKFSQGNVYLAVHKAENSVKIAVRDTGIGIAQSDVEAIFETFYQIDSSSTRRYGGMGVGLAIVRLILDNHDTKISVASQVGKGSTFSFELPIVEMH